VGAFLLSIFKGVDEMSEQDPTATVTPAESATPEAITPQQPAENVDELKRRISELNRESADRRKKLEAFEKAEADRKQAEMTEAERMKAKLAEAETALIEARKMAIAAKHGLPDVLADRLKGNTIEELEADAAKLMETLPKKAATQPGPTNPGTQGAAKETDAERRKRLGLG
jgi:hypothetical protein